MSTTISRDGLLWARVRDWVGRHPVASFFVIAYAISWGIWSPLVVGGWGRDGMADVLMLAGGFGPPLAAALVVWATEGPAGVRHWAGQILRWRVNIGWYLVALFGLLVLGYVSFGVYLLMGGAAGANWQLRPWYAYPLTLAAFLFIGGGQEEPGWRGFALPRLQERYGPLAASLIVGVLWAVWHAPLFLWPGSDQAAIPFTLYLPALVAFSVILAWLFNGTGGSVLLPMLMHAALNVSTAPAPLPLHPGQQTGPFFGTVQVAVYWLAAATLVVLYRPRRLWKKPFADGATVRTPAEA
jgi:membrane protease YdiL (CAAX protease family)